MINNNKLYLVKNPDMGNKFIDYCISTINMDDTTDYETIFLIACDIMDEVFTDMTVLSHNYYQPKKPSKKRLFLKDKPAVFEKGGFADKVIERIKTDNLNYEYCVKENNKNKHCSKVLHVGIDKYCYDFLELVSDKADYGGDKPHFDFQITGYNKQDAEKFADFNELVEDLSTRNKSAVFFMGESYYSAIKITVNPYRYSVEKLMQIIDKVMKKYGKELEINI